MTTQVIHKSLHRPNLIFGGDREAVMFSFLFAFCIGFGGFTLISAIAGIVFWIGSLMFWRRLAKKDPLYIKVYIRYIRQQRYYYAHKSIWRRR